MIFCLSALYETNEVVKETPAAAIIAAGADKPNNVVGKKVAPAEKQETFMKFSANHLMPELLNAFLKLLYAGSNSS